MRSFRRYVSEQFLIEEEEVGRLIGLMGLFFLVVCAVGVLRPIRNALALDGLGSSDFYKVYLVSAVVIIFAPLINYLSDRISWRWLIPGMAFFFALNLVAFRAYFREESAAFGMLFYGWYDLFSAALVTQFFMTTQLFFNARNAKQAYPLVVAGGSIGATLGAAITGFFAERIGSADLLLVAAALMVAFGAALPLIWRAAPAAGKPLRKTKEELSRREMMWIFSHPHVRLIAGTVLLAVLVKQLVDYQFNALTLEVFETRDAVSAFQGKFNAATQWLPLVVVLALRPLMRRWGIGVAVLLLPAAMFLASMSLAVWWGLWPAVAAKASDASLRYSAERTGREILYVPLPEEMKLKAKAYIDVGVEKGLGKVLSAALIFLLLLVMEYRDVAYVAVGLAFLWLVVAVGVRREYLRALARSIESRTASLRGVFASISDATTRAAVRVALNGGDLLQTTFALDLLQQADRADVRGFSSDLHDLLEDPSPAVRLRALGVIGRLPEVADDTLVRQRLDDPDPAVRQAAVHVLCSARPEERDRIIQELLSSPSRGVRTAALSSLAVGEVSSEGARLEIRRYLNQQRRRAQSEDREERIELALAAGAAADGDEVRGLIDQLIDDPDPEVAAAAIRSAGKLKDPRYDGRFIEALAVPATRAAARDALVEQGETVVGALEARLRDPRQPRVLRRAIPGVLARIPAPVTVQTLLSSVAAPETDQMLDFRTLKALNKLRARHPDLPFPLPMVRAAVSREVQAAARYAAARGALEAVDSGGRATDLLKSCLEEGWKERREGAFRCLGLIYPPRETYRCYMAVAGAAERARGNALEWLEQTTGYVQFNELGPVLRSRPWPEGSGHDSVDEALEELCRDDDPWIATCARRVIGDLSLAAASAPRSEAVAPQVSTYLPEAEGMDIIEKVSLLQQIDLLKGARTAHLALLASIAEEVDVEADELLIELGEPTLEMYVVIRGAVELRAASGELIAATDGSSFGTWSLIEEAPSLVEARTVRASRLLRITRDEFHDLLSEYPELAMGMLQGLAHRVRTLVA